MKLNNYLLTEGINDKGIFKAVFMAGTPGAGKTLVTTKLRGGVQPRTVNSDVWTNFLQVGTQWRHFRDKVKLLTEQQLVLYLNSMLPLWIDGTSSNPSNLLKRDGILGSFGYDTGMIWVNTDLETAIERAKAREKETGRVVEEDFIRTTYDSIQKLKPYYKNRFKYFKEVNNSEGELTDEVVTKLFKTSSSFFTGKLANPIGNAHIKELQENGGKYLADLEGYDLNRIKQQTKGWFSY